jgi:hypothetical protein
MNLERLTARLSNPSGTAGAVSADKMQPSEQLSQTHSLDRILKRVAGKLRKAKHPAPGGLLPCAPCVAHLVQQRYTEPLYKLQQPGTRCCGRGGPLLVSRSSGDPYPGSPQSHHADSADSA